MRHVLHYLPRTAISSLGELEPPSFRLKQPYALLDCTSENDKGRPTGVETERGLGGGVLVFLVLGKTIVPQRVRKPKQGGRECTEGLSGGFLVLPLHMVALIV